MRHDIADLRKDYKLSDLSKADAPEDPLVLFSRWFLDAEAAEVREPTGMVLATVGSNGQPSARVVLLKGFDESGFSFFTNYESRKGAELDAHPVGALVFWWPELERQVRIEGTVERVPAGESDAYYHSRPRGSRLGAWASPQSRKIEGRGVLEQRVEKIAETYKDTDPQRPPFWGGYRVVPKTVEFWQGRPSRLHDRLEYRRQDGAWGLVRLAP